MTAHEVRRWYNPSSGVARVMSAMAFTGFGTVIAKVGLALQEILVARRFGSSGSVEAFLFGASAITFLNGMLVTSLVMACVPSYVRAREHGGPPARDRLVSSVSFVVICLLSGIVAIIGALAPFALHFVLPKFDASRITETVLVLAILLPTVVLAGLSANWGAALNAVGRFGSVAAAPAAPPLCLVAYLLWTREPRVSHMAISVLVGAVLQTVFMAQIARRNGISVMPHWAGVDEGLRTTASEYTPMVMATAFQGSTVLVDQSMASALGSGSLAIFTYATRIPMFILVVLATSLGTALLPHFSGIAAQAEWDRLRVGFARALRWILVVSVPLTAISIWASPALVRIVFQGGAFSVPDASAVTDVQRWFLLVIPAYLVGIVVPRIVSAVQANRLTMWVALLSALLNVALNLLLMPRSASRESASELPSFTPSPNAFSSSLCSRYFDDSGDGSSGLWTTSA